MRTIAYLRVSKDSQDVKNQRLTILDFARQERLEIDEFIELSVSATRTPKERKLDVLLERLKPQDALLVSELSRMVFEEIDDSGAAGVILGMFKNLETSAGTAKGHVQNFADVRFRTVGHQE